MANLGSRAISLGAVFLLVAVQSAAAPVISATNWPEATRSGRVAITGSGFGTDGEVIIAGLTAWTTTWTDSRVVAYVPETAPLGAATLQIVAGGQTSNAVTIGVTARQSDGRFRWRFETDGDNLWWRPAVAPNGTVYLHTNNETDGLVYALSPQGALLWVQKVVWFPYVPASTGPDNEVYVGSIDRIYRIGATGQIDWMFQDLGANSIQVGPAIGPDGLLYGAFESGEGAFALDPLTGQAEWRNIGDPRINDVGNLGTEAVFGRAGPGEPLDRFYTVLDGTVAIHAFSLDGDQLFTGGLANNLAHEPAIGSDGTIYVPGYLDRWIVAKDPQDGTELWSYNDWASKVSDPEIDADDMLYFVSDSGKLEAYDPISRSRRWRTNTSLALSRPTLSPDETLLVVSGSHIGDEPIFVKGFSTNNGRERWSVDLPSSPYANARILDVHRPRITADGATAYVSTLTLEWPLPTGDPHAYLYAIEVDSSPGGPDSDGDGVHDNTDNCTNVPNPDQRDTSGDGFGNLCDPDINNDCIVNFLDLLSYRANFFQTGDFDTDNNGDGITNFLDLLVVREHFFGPAGPSANGCN